MQATAVKFGDSVEIDFFTDRPGYDFPDSPINLGGGADADDCEAECNAEPACVCFAFDTCGSGNCWLKSAVHDPLDHGCRVSLDLFSVIQYACNSYNH